jgi:hypothetical protein
VLEPFFYLLKSKTHMENLKIRVTLSNGKGWKETKIVELAHYLMEKEKGNHLLDETLEELLNNQNNVENTIEQNKSTYQKWRP